MIKLSDNLVDFKIKVPIPGSTAKRFINKQTLSWRDINNAVNNDPSLRHLPQLSNGDGRVQFYTSMMMVKHKGDVYQVNIKHFFDGSIGVLNVTESDDPTIFALLGIDGDYHKVS